MEKQSGFSHVQSQTSSHFKHQDMLYNVQKLALCEGWGGREGGRCQRREDRPWAGTRSPQQTQQQVDARALQSVEQAGFYQNKKQLHPNDQQKREICRERKR